MKITKFTQLLLAVFISCLCLPLSSESSPEVSAAISGKSIFTEKIVTVTSGQKGSVLIFMSSQCPCSNSHVQVVKKLANEFSEFAFAVVHSNSDESQATSRDYFKTAGFPFPVIEDDNSKLADRFRASRTPHAFLLGLDGKVLFSGGVTNSTNGESADQNYLRDALMNIRAGEDVKIAKSRTLGCDISRGTKHVL